MKAKPETSPCDVCGQDLDIDASECPCGAVLCMSCGAFVTEYDQDRDCCVECAREAAIARAEARMEMM